MGRRRKKNHSSSESPTKSQSESLEPISDISSPKPVSLPDYQISYILNHKREVFEFPFCDNPIGATLIHYIAREGQSNVLQELSALGPPENWLEIQDYESGFTPLHEAMYHGNISCAVNLVKLGATLDKPDFDNFTPIDLLMCRDEPQIREYARFNVFTWGSNTNYNLGHPHDKSLSIPEKVKVFNRPAFSSSICDVTFGKYHTLFLDTDGNVYSCGYGPGGRLGHGNEQTVLEPQKVNSLRNIVTISCSHDHSMAVDSDGVVFTWGINTHKVLGVSDPNIKMCSTPQAIKSVAIEQKVISVFAAKYHSVLVTTNEIYTFGSNGGQIGHAVESGSYQIIPRKVTRLHSTAEIVAVHASTAATVIGLDDGTIFICTQYKVKKIASVTILTGSIKMKTLQVTGGEICVEDNSVLKPILVTVLDSNGSVYCCCPSLFPNALMYYWSVYNDGFRVKDIALGSSAMLLLSHKGDVYTCDPHPNLKTEKEMKKYHHGKESAHQIVVSGKKENLQMLKPIKVSRIPGLEKVTKVTCNPTGQSKGCIVQDRISTIDYIPHLEASSYAEDFIGNLFDHEDFFDSDLCVYDGEGNHYKVHKAMLANYSEKMSQMFTDEFVSSIEIKEKAVVVETFLKTFYQCDESLLQCSNPALKKSISNLHKFYDLRPIDGTINRTSISSYSDVKLFSSEKDVFDCHQCVLAARTDYFRTHFSVNSRWGNAQSNEHIPVDASTRTLSDLLYYIYTDKFPKHYNFDSLKLLMKVADQYLLSRLKSFCEEKIIEFITEENLIHILRTSNDYNAHQLRAVCLHILAMNIPHYLEQRKLDCLEDEILRNLDRVYKEVVLFDVNLYLNDFISVTEWFSNIPQAGVNVLDNYLIESKDVVEIPGLPKVLEYNYVSDESEEGDFPQHDVTPEVLEVGDFDDLSMTENCVDVNINSKMQDCEGTERKVLEIDTNPPIHPASPWSPLQHSSLSLTQIMKLEEEKANMEKCKPNPVKASKTKSSVLPSSNTTFSKKCPWTTPTLPASSLRDIMSQDAQTIRPKPPQSSQAHPKPSPRIAPSEIHDFNLNKIVHSLADIMESEKKQLKESLATKNFSRPLNIIQIEEKALQELSLHYKIEETYDELIIIRTVCGEFGRPLWTRPHK